MKARALIALLVLTALTPFVSAPLAAQSPAVPRVVSTDWLAQHLTDPSVVLIEIGHSGDPDPHIPGARVLPYGRLTVRNGTVTTELPSTDSLRALFAAFGVSDDSHVVVYAHEGPMATRALFSLATIDHPRYSLLDGGVAKWRAERRPVTTTAAAITPGRLAARPARSLVADAEFIRARLGRPGLALIDTRTDGEYNGSGNRSGMPSAGHLSGARQLQWEELFAEDGVTLKPRAALEQLFAERVRPGDAVVTYCWVGYRASATWFVAHWLGYDAKLYDGSYQDWSQRALPTAAGATP